MLSCQKHLFQLPDTVAYLNCAYLSPQLRSVETAGIAALRKKNFPFALQVKDFFEPVERARTLFAQIINAPNPQRIALIPSVSYGIATVANNLHLTAKDHIVVVEDQFPSNMYSWQRLAARTGAQIKTVKAPQSAPRTPAWNDALLAAIDDRTRLVAIANVHWADGTRFDLAAVRACTREAGALLVIDGTQSVGALPIDVTALQPDALICAGYKWLLGPYSIGLAYYGLAFDDGVPIEENWINRLHSEDFKNLVQYQPEYQPGAARYSVGEQSNFTLLPMLNAAMEQLLAWGVENIQQYTREVSQEALQYLKSIGCEIEDDAHRCGHLFGIRLPEDRFDFQRLTEAFAQQQVFVSLRGSAIRVSPNVYNDSGDFEKLVACFEMARINTSVVV